MVLLIMNKAMPKLNPFESLEIFVFTLSTAAKTVEGINVEKSEIKKMTEKASEISHMTENQVKQTQAIALMADVTGVSTKKIEEYLEKNKEAIYRILKKN